MLEKSFGLLFFLRKQRNADKGLMYIYLRITVDGISKELSVKRSWPPSRWNAKANRASGNKENAKELNHYLDVLQNKAYEARKKLIENGKILTASAIIDIMSGAEQRKRELMTLFKSHNDDLKAMIGKGVAKGTWTNFNISYRHVSEFLTMQYLVKEINILSLDLEFVKKLYNWFRIVKNLGHNSALKNTELQKQYIDVSFRINEQGYTHGITYIDNNNKTVFNGNDLGKAYNAKAILDRLSATDKWLKPELNIEHETTPKQREKRNAAAQNPPQTTLLYLVNFPYLHQNYFSFFLII